MYTYSNEPKLMVPDSFSCLKMHQNTFETGAPPRTPQASLQRFPNPVAGFKEAASQAEGGRERGGRQGQAKGGNMFSSVQFAKINVVLSAKHFLFNVHYTIPYVHR